MICTPAHHDGLLNAIRIVSPLRLHIAQLPSSSGGDVTFPAHNSAAGGDHSVRSNFKVLRAVDAQVCRGAAPPPLQTLILEHQINAQAPGIITVQPHTAVLQIRCLRSAEDTRLPFQARLQE